MTVVAGFLIDNGPQIALVTASVAKVNTTLLLTEAALASMAANITAITVAIGKSNRGVAVGVKSTDANFNYNVNVNVLTARNALAGPDDQIPIPPPPVGL